MIDIKELRLGNWVLCNGLRTIINIRLMIEIFHKDIRWDISPIKVDKEILSKVKDIEYYYKEYNDTFDEYFEIKINDACYLQIDCDDFSSCLYESKDNSLNSFTVLPEWNSTKYLHNLQNLCFSLGKEIIIDL